MINLQCMQTPWQANFILHVPLQHIPISTITWSLAHTLNTEPMGSDCAELPYSRVSANWHGVSLLVVQERGVVSDSSLRGILILSSLPQTSSWLVHGQGYTLYPSPLFPMHFLAIFSGGEQLGSSSLTLGAEGAFLAIPYAGRGTVLQTQPFKLRSQGPKNHDCL